MKATFFLSVFSPPPPTKAGQTIFRLACLFISSVWGKNLLFLAFWNNGKLHTKFSFIFLTKNLFLKNNVKITTKNLPYFLTKNLPYFLTKNLPTKNSVKSLPKIYLTFLTKKINVWRGPFTKSGQNVFFKFYCKNNVKSLPKIYLTFLTKKSMCEGGRHQIRAKIFKRQFLRFYGLWDLILQFYGFCPNMTIAIFFLHEFREKEKF